jgi:hypothetical protein
MDGVFCGNFCFSRGPFRLCRKVWCAGYYTPRKMVTFFTYEPEDEDGFTWIKKGDEKRFKVARNGDNLLTPFQCELCVFRNLHLREPARTQTDELALCDYRRANLDAFWSRERSTVSSNRLWIKRGAELNQAMDHQSTYPALGPMPLEDLAGYGIASFGRPGRLRDSVPGINGIHSTWNLSCEPLSV